MNREINICIKGVFIFIIVLLTSCGKIKNGDALYEETKSGIVLVRVDNYYELRSPDGYTMYFTDIDDDGSLSNLTSNQDSIKKSTGYGTGFIISDKGEIATANHVIQRSINENEVRNSIFRAIERAKSDLNYEYQSLCKDYEDLQFAIEYGDLWGEPSDNMENRIHLYAIEQRIEECRQLYSNLSSINPHTFNISQKTSIGIAYNDTHITDDSDFIPCVSEKVDEENDLAVIQLKDKTTPKDKYVFSIPSADPLENYSYIDKILKSIYKDKNENIFMIGFNLGPALALTSEGLKAQVNKGNISQKQDTRLLYSIPALPGSSGSPVINSEGELIGVNHAGINQTQSFNYGIRVKHLRKLFE